ncbi:MAG: ATP synthase F1 subunit epsilon [bacterium]|nr:ATP synthase F1 subunit epsilon [bacterium]
MSERTQFTVKTITPSGVQLEKTATFARISSSIGEIGIMPNHTPSLVTIEPCEFVVRVGEKEELSYFVPEGIAQIKEGELILVVPYIEAMADIDKGRAEQAKKRAQERLAGKIKDEETDIKRAEASFKRAENRLKTLAQG